MSAGDSIIEKGNNYRELIGPVYASYVCVPDQS